MIKTTITKKQKIKYIEITEKLVMPILDIDSFFKLLKKIESEKDVMGFVKFSWEINCPPQIIYNKKIVNN